MFQAKWWLVIAVVLLLMVAVVVVAIWLATSLGVVELDAQIAKTDVHSNFTSTCSETRCDTPRLACRRLAIFNLSDRPLMERATAALLARLKKLAHFDQIDCHPMVYPVEEGGLAPDIFITLDLSSLEESATPLSRTLDATIRITAGASLAHGRYSVCDHLSPPMLQFNWQGSLEQHSTTTGISLPAGAYKAAAEDIAKQIDKNLSKLFQKFREKDGLLPELPREFYPAYRQPKILLPLGAYASRRLVAYHGLMNHNETFWQLTTDRDVAEVLDEICKSMEAAGWKTEYSSTKEKDLQFLRMEQDAVVLEVFPRKDHFGKQQIDNHSDTDRPAEPTVLYVHYLDRMTRKEIQSAVDRAFVGDYPLDTLLLFRGQWTKGQRRRMLERLESHHPKTARQWLTLADLYHHRKRDAEARNALLCAHTMQQTTFDQDGLSSKIKNLAKELDDEKLVERPIDRALMKELGFRELKPGANLSPVELALGEPALFFGETAKGTLKRIAMRVTADLSKGGHTGYWISQVVSHEGGRSKSSQSWKARSIGVAGCPIDGVLRATFQLVKLPEVERFRLTVKLSDIQHKGK